MKRKQFTFYRSYWEAILTLKPKQKLECLEAILNYALDGTQPEKLGSVASTVFQLVKPTLDSGRRMAEGSLKGKARYRQGRANEKEKEIEIENEIENEIETETEKEAEGGTHGMGQPSARGECVGFDIFWDKYPVKIDRERAEIAYTETGQKPERLLHALEDWLESRQWSREHGRYIPRAEKWLREGHYLHTPVRKVPMGATGLLSQSEVEALRQVLV